MSMIRVGKNVWINMAHVLAIEDFDSDASADPVLCVTFSETLKVYFRGEQREVVLRILPKTIAG